MKPLYVFGAGGHAACVIEAARASGLAPAAVLDDHPRATHLLGVPIFESSEILRSDVVHHNSFRFVVAIGNCAVRAEKFLGLLALGGEPQSVIHPRAWVSSSAQIGAGSVLFAGVAVDPDVTIGRNCILNMNAAIGHDSRIADHVHVAPGCSLAGGTVLEDRVWFGIHSCTIQGVRVGAGSMVGAGSVVARDIPAGVVAKGNPAHHDMRPVSAPAPLAVVHLDHRLVLK